MRLREIRESKGISQRQAALGLNLSPTVYNRYINPNVLLHQLLSQFSARKKALPDEKREGPKLL